MSKLACVQITSVADVGENLATVEQQVKKSVEAGAAMVVLPENFAFMGKYGKDQLEISEALGHGRIQDFIAELAKKHSVWIVAGTLPIKSDHENKVYATCFIYDSQGRQKAHYNKIHLFDVDLPESNEHYRESSVFEAGKDICVLDTPLGKLGVAVCYDLRFPELFRLMQLQGMEVLALPSAFTAMTGAAHWLPLLQARAIENQCYVAAAAQVGEHADLRKTYGHSLIIDPWGSVLSCLENEVGSIAADISLDKLKAVRKTFPALQHRTIL